MRSLPRRIAIRVLVRTGNLERYFAGRRAIRRGRRAWRLRRGAPVEIRRHAQRLSGVTRLVGRTWVICEAVERLTFTEARDSNFRLAADVLDRAGVDYFYIEIRDYRQRRLGVDIRDRERVVDAMLTSDLPALVHVRPAGVKAEAVLPLAVGDRDRLGRELDAARLWWLYLNYTSPGGVGVVGIDASCQIEFWMPRYLSTDVNGTRVVTAEESDTPSASVEGEEAGETDEVPVGLRSARPNMLTRRLTYGSHNDDRLEIAGCVVPVNADVRKFHLSRQFPHPVDVVYTWVDGHDPAWIERRNRALGIDRAQLSADADSKARYHNRDELRYSLRSLHQNAPWVRHVYLVTDRQVPSWLDPEAPGLSVVDHSSIFGADDRLPTFNSHAIESRLHRIEGLSEHYIYVNDDVFFARPVIPTLFFTRAGHSKYFPSRAIVPIGRSTPEDPAVTSAAKNARDLIFEEFGEFPLQKMKHTPHPQRKSTLLELEKRFPEVMARVGRAQFRSVTDVPVASWLQHYAGAALGSAVEGSIRYQYVNLAAFNLPDRLDALAAGSFDAWCLNDVDVDDESSDRVDSCVIEFLARAFEWPSPWERTT